jgi:Uma2 family endonuclease
MARRATAGSAGGYCSVMVQAVPGTDRRAPQYIGLRLSADEYLSLPDDGFRYQLINGVVVRSPSPTPRHQSVIIELAGQVRDYLKGKPIGRVFAELDVRLAADLVYRPDLVFLRHSRIKKPLRRIDVAPDIVVEVLSPDSASMDLQTKLADYERHGVGEYWVVSLDSHIGVRLFQLENGRFIEQRGALASAVLPGFALDQKALDAAAEM